MRALRGSASATATPRRTRAGSPGSLRQNSWIAEAGAARLPGGTVVLRVREREAARVIEGRGGPLGVDAEGRPFAVLDARDAKDLPRLRCENAPPPGEPDRGSPRRSGRALVPVARARAAARDRARQGAGSGRARAAAAGHRGALRARREGSRRARGMLAELLAKRPAEVAEAASVDLRFAGQAVLSGKTDPKGSA
jgi:hypothetical protein